MKAISALCLLCLLCSFFPVTKAQKPHFEKENSSCISYIPSAFSPNGDGINDLFEVKLSCPVPDFQIRIFDTDKKVLFSSQNSKSWNGVVAGKPQPEGHYSWEISYQAESGVEILKKGKVLLVR